MLALAIATLANELDAEREWRELDRLGDELAGIGDQRDLPVYRWHGRFLQATAAAKAGEVEDAYRLVTESLELARVYHMPEATFVGECALATFAHITGHLEDAERHYAAAGQMARQGWLHATGFLLLTEATIQVGEGRVADLAPRAAEFEAAFGPLAADLLAAALAGAGRAADARRARAQRASPRPPTTFRAMAVIALGERDTAQEVYAALLPYRDASPAAADLAVAIRPVAHTLGQLALLLGHDTEAAGHFAHAAAVAERWGAHRWASEARTAMAAR